MAETKGEYTYNISQNDLHEFFTMHNQLTDSLYKLNNKVALLQILRERCVELEAYDNKNYELLCTAIREAQYYSAQLDEASDKCRTLMQNMLGR